MRGTNTRSRERETAGQSSRRRRSRGRGLPGVRVVGTGAHAAAVTGVGAGKRQALAQLRLARQRVTQRQAVAHRHLRQSGGHGPATVVSGEGTHGVGGVHGAKWRQVVGWDESGSAAKHVRALLPLLPLGSTVLEPDLSHRMNNMVTCLPAGHCCHIGYKSRHFTAGYEQHQRALDPRFGHDEREK